MFDGSVNGWGSFGYTLDYAAPLLIVAFGTIVAVRAGQFNVGQEGQLMIGAARGRARRDPRPAGRDRSW